MVPPEVRAMIMVNHGYRYIDDISVMLGERGITNKKGNSYDKPAISKVMSNERSNPVIEAVIREKFKDVFDEYERKLVKAQ